MSDDDARSAPRAHGRRRGTPRDETPPAASETPRADGRLPDPAERDASPDPSTAAAQSAATPPPARRHGRRARRLEEPPPDAPASSDAKTPAAASEEGPAERTPARAAYAHVHPESLDAWLEPGDASTDLGYPVEFEGTADDGDDRTRDEATGDDGAGHIGTEHVGIEARATAEDAAPAADDTAEIPRADPRPAEPAEPADDDVHDAWTTVPRAEPTAPDARPLPSHADLDRATRGRTHPAPAAPAERTAPAAPAAPPESPAPRPVEPAPTDPSADAPAPAALPTETPTAPSTEAPASLPTEAPAAPSTEAPAAPSPRPSEPGLSVPFRVEIHGLRAIAILLVAVYHIWFGRVSGGVDVFLFISAFLLTGSFARRLESGRPLAVPRYWLKTFKRLLPPAVVTILGSLVLAFTVLPPTIWATVQRQAWASALYVQNYVLAADSVDYYAHDAAAASPLQHFWSMSIQGQIFLLWPLLFALGAVLIRRLPALRAHPRWLMAGMFSLVIVISLVWSIVSTASNQTFAYFDTAARLWEFALGSLLGLMLPRIDRATGATTSNAAPPRFAAARAVIGWVGLAALLSCGALLDVQGMFPGWIAIWPLAAAGLVILAGRSGRAWGADAFLSLRPVAFLGSIAYALYLAHWPLLIGWLALTGQERAGALDGAGVLAVSLLIAWLLTRLVDTPIRRSAWLDARPRRALAAVAVSLVVVLVGSQAVFPAVGERSLTVAQGSQDDDGASDGGPAAPTVPNPGAQWTVDPMTDGFGTTIPSPDVVTEPSEHTYAEDCQKKLDLPGTVTCRYTPAPDGDPDLTVALAGDSHAGQYTGAILQIAKERNWAVYYIGHSGCTFTTDPATNQCKDVNTSWETLIDGVDPDVLITMGTRTSFDGGSDSEADRKNLDSALPLTTERGIPVLLLRDNPRWPKKEESGNRFDCAFDVLREGGDAAQADAECGDDMRNRMDAENPSAHRASDDPYAPIRIADPATDVLCPKGRCSPIIGNVFVYRDSYHLTDAFSRTMDDWFEKQIDATLAMKDPDAEAPQTEPSDAG
ncbi:acyltransferase family protein [Brachybacterium halotolerans subsp. kimchii]|uniref:SGNH hydrolase domain-containing protein n=1 Tax=Brachybacterium halotolerans TaxID=2795215 RepID=UPI001E49B863|nr:SGNH hydrolase domain-containing protein [Brachybacterium halotolerans]UEJ84180.1 acyltransferase family protein [Brachybacterium halotolerans subsp. kimchii]